MRGLPSMRLSTTEAALVTAYLIRKYEDERGKPITRLRLSKSSLRRLALRHRLREAFVQDWQDELASGWGWIVSDHGDEFGLVRSEVISGWVRIGTKRIASERQKLRRGDRSVLGAISEYFGNASPEDDDTDD